MKQIAQVPTFSLVSLLLFSSPFFAVVLTGCSGDAPDSTSVASAHEALWCKEHGVEEKYCVLCHPELRDDPDILLCPKHGKIPEAICTACHPELKEKYETCPHELPTAFCPECSPEFAATLQGDSETGETDHDHSHDHDQKDDHDHASKGAQS